jgi:uncharacterized repeat protein (TIGR03803 family)
MNPNSMREFNVLASKARIINKSTQWQSTVTRLATFIAFAAITPAALAQTITTTTLYAFSGVDGADPQSGLIQGSDGNFYGTTSGGGVGGCAGFGCGTVFQLTPDGSLTTLYSFSGPDGANPYAGLIQSRDGYFYGTAEYSGLANAGTVFRITSNGSLTTLYSFSGTDGQYPFAGLIEGSDGNFYGTTIKGGAVGSGTVFRLTPAGALTRLYSFSGSDGATPYGGLIQGRDGNFYGTTQVGGTSGVGTVYQITPIGQLTTLHSFNTTDGAYPWSRLIQGSDGNFYGTTTKGGASGAGTVFQITASGTLSVLYSFINADDGARPYASLMQSSDGNFYGTANEGGLIGAGTVFQLTPAGALTTLHSFSGDTDGGNPWANIIQTADGSFYGTTYSGGGGASGTVFKLQLPSGPAAPTALTATLQSRGTALLSWNAPAAGTISYNVYQGASTGQESATPVLTGITTTTATLKGLRKRQTYCFTVAGVNASGAGLPSNEACISGK